MKMEPKERIKWNFLLLVSLIAFQSFGESNIKKETHRALMQVNTHWGNLADEIEFTFTPNSEQELIQLHLLNVISYLESQPIHEASKKQQENRLSNIAILQDYCRAGNFPIHTTTSFRSPVFIDSQNTHCAVGYLLKENRLGNVAQEIADSQLLFFLNDIEHSGLNRWQKDCGFSFFELALIQPTYGPAIPICATPSPIKWKDVAAKGEGISQLFKSENEHFIYGISRLDELGLKHEIKRFSAKNQLWKSIGSKIKGEILDLAVCDDKIYISVVLPEEYFPHQLLILKGNKWEKAAHFDGHINALQAHKNKLYVLGNFKKTNDTIPGNFIVLEDNNIQSFDAFGLKNIPFDHMTSSKTALYLMSYGSVYRVKNDTIHYLSQMQYYQYMKHMTLDAIGDTLYVSSLSIPGYNKYFNNREHPFHIGNMLYGQDYPYRSIHFTKSKMINGQMMVAGDFGTSTLTPQINDERYLVQCTDSASKHWYGEGLLYQKGHMYFPILEQGIVVDFVQLNDVLYILKKDGSMSYAGLGVIEKQIMQLKKKGQLFH